MVVTFVMLLLFCGFGVMASSLIIKGISDDSQKRRWSSSPLPPRRWNSSPLALAVFAVGVVMTVVAMMLIFFLPCPPACTT